MALKDTDLKTLAVQILATYSLPVSASAALEAAMDGKSPTEERVEALRLLAGQHPRSDELKEGLDHLIHGKTPESLRSEALGALLVEDQDLAVKEAARLLDSGTVREKQKALDILAAARSPEADSILAAQMDALSEGKSAPPVQLDILEGAQSRSAKNTALANKIAAFEKSRAAAAGTTADFAECLEGGDANAGREIAHENLLANCMLCHRFEAKEGSNVGPPLGTIGKQRDRAYLLESLIVPTAKIATGYGIVALTMKKGPVISGALAAANDKELQIRLADGTLKKVPVEDIKSKTDPVSIMPPMGSILNKHEIRDLLAYLASLDGSGGKKKKKK
jgi:putative heme-binding domain-containing protein